jgi:hypothetical protein
MTVAQRMGESMESLQVDLIASPGSPTFFKACNRTYFFIPEKVFILHPRLNTPEKSHDDQIINRS